MSDYVFSAVLIVPAASREAANDVGAAMGWGPDNFTVALSADGTGPASHYICRAQVRQGFVDDLADPPPDVAGAAEVIAAMIADVQQRADGFEHAQEVLAAQGLQRVEAIDAEA